MSHAAQDTHEDEYDEGLIKFLEAVWGEGYLSPGGPEEVRNIVGDEPLDDAHILDLGCGAGGITSFLAQENPKARFVGFDIEAPVIAQAKKRASALGLQDRVSFVRGAPGPLPFDDASFDVVFSKDALIHVADKEAIYREIYRVLKPGGRFMASDWMIGHDDTPSPAMQRYLEAEGLNFGMASPTRCLRAMQKAGFISCRHVDRNGWYLEQAKAELAAMSGPEYDRIRAAAGQALLEKNITIWTEMIAVLESGEHRPGHLFGVKPA